MTIKNLLFMLSMAMLVLQCGDVITAGTGSSTETALVAGRVYEPDGTTPASNVNVYIRTNDAFALLPNDVGVEEMFEDSVRTDADGGFSFDTSLEVGTYMVEARKGTNAAVIHPVAVPAKDSLVTLPPMTLTSTGCITGRIRLSDGGDPRNVYVLVSGVNRFVQVDSDSAFTITALAAGVYDLKVVTVFDVYSSFDTAGVTVVSTDTTSVGTIALIRKGISVPENISLSMDELKKIVTVSWEVDDSSSVTSYNIYRMKIDSSDLPTYRDAPSSNGPLPPEIGPFDNTDDEYKAFMRINEKLVTATTFNDSSVDNFCLYAYRVTAVDTAASEGSYGTSDPIYTESVFRLVRTIVPEGNSGYFTGITLSGGSDECIRLYDDRPGLIRNFTMEGTFISEWHIGDREGSGTGLMNWIGAVRDGSTYIICQSLHELIKIDSQGTELWRSGTSDPWLTVFSVDELGHVWGCARTYDLMSSPQVQHYSPDGELLGSWTPEIIIGRGFAVKNGKIYSCSIGEDESSLNGSEYEDKYLAVFDTSGVLLEQVPIERHGAPREVKTNDIIVDDGGGVVVIDMWNNAVRFFDATYEFTGQMMFPSGNGKFYRLLQGEAGSDGSLFLSFRTNGCPDDCSSSERGIVYQFRCD